MSTRPLFDMANVLKSYEQGIGAEYAFDVYRPGRARLRYDFLDSGANLNCEPLAAQDEGALQLLAEKWQPDAVRRFQLECRAADQFNTRPVLV